MRVAGLAIPWRLLHIPDSPYDDYELIILQQEEDMWIQGAAHNQPRNSMALTTRSIATM